MKSKDEIIKELEDKYQMEKMVKNSERELNKTLTEHNEKLKLHIETIVKINEEFSNRIVSLQEKINKLI
jgi:chaperonin cofactor prefoldin